MKIRTVAQEFHAANWQNESKISSTTRQQFLCIVYENTNNNFLLFFFFKIKMQVRRCPLTEKRAKVKRAQPLDVTDRRDALDAARTIRKLNKHRRRVQFIYFPFQDG